MKNAAENNRRHPRISVRIPALIYVKSNPGKAIRAEISNISEGGAFVHCSIPIVPGEELNVEILFAHTRLIEGRVMNEEETIQKIISSSSVKEVSIVRWVRGTSESGFGIQFTELTPEKREFLKKIVGYFQKLVDAGFEL